MITGDEETSDITEGMLNALHILFPTFIVYLLCDSMPQCFLMIKIGGELNACLKKEYNGGSNHISALINRHGVKTFMSIIK